MTRRWRVRSVDRLAGRQVSAKLTDEGPFVSCPARRQCPPNTTAALAATYPLRCSAPRWARFDNRHSISAPAPILSLHQRQRRRRYKQSPEPTTIPAVPIPRDQHRQICTCPPRAKGSLNRRSKWFSLVPFFLQKKKGTRAGGTKRPIPRPQAQHLFAATRAFPHVIGVFLIVVGPPTVPAQLSAAAACYYGKNYSFCRVAG